jgi:hypothetical protein
MSSRRPTKRIEPPGAGIRWGDRIIAVNRIDPRKKTVTELEILAQLSETNVNDTQHQPRGPTKDIHN